MADETLSVDIIADVSDFTGDMDRAADSIDELESKCRGAQGGMGGLGGSTEGLRSKFSALTGVVAGVAQEITSRLLGAVMDLGGEMVAASDSAQKFASTLKFGIKGISDTEIQSLIDSTQKYADETVYDLADIRNVTAQLASNGVKDYAALAEAAGNLNAVAGGNADTFKSVSMVMTQTAGMQKLTTENWNQMAEAIPGASGALQDAMREAGAFDGNFREAMENGEISADEFFAAVQKLGMTDVAKEAATSTKTIEGAVGNLEASVVGVGASLIDAFKPFITGGISQLSTAISQIPALFQQVAAVATPAFQPLATALQSAGTALAPLVAQLGGSFMGLMQSIAPIVQTVATYLASWFAALVNIGAAIASTVVPILTQVVDFISGTLIPVVMPAIQSIFDAVQSTFPAIQAVIETALGVVEGVWNAVWPAIQAVLETVFSVISGVVSTVMGAISAVITAVMQVISGDWEGAWNTISSFLSGVWESMKSTVSGAIDGVIQFFIDLPGNILDALGDFGSLLVSAGGDLIDGLINGIKGAAGAVGDMLLGIVDDAIGGVLSFLGIASPSKLMAEIGGYTMEGFTVGVDRQAVSAMKEVRASFADVVGGAETALSGLTFGGSMSYAAAPSSSGDTNTYYITIDGASVGADAELAKALDAYTARIRQRGRMKARR